MAKKEGGALSAVLGVFGGSAAVVTVVIIIPAAVSSGHTKEAVATALIMGLLWFLYRLLFGQEEADQLLKSRDDED